MYMYLKNPSPTK